MPDVGVLGLIARMVLSLGAVLAVIAVAFAIARRRVNGSLSSARSVSGRGRRKAATPPIEVVGRAGLTRGAVAIAVRFGDQVILVAVAEDSPITVLQEMDAARWDAWDQDDAAPSESTPFSSEMAAADPAAAAAHSIIAPPRPTLIEALRDATSRRV